MLKNLIFAIKLHLPWEKTLAPNMPKKSKWINVEPSFKVSGSIKFTYISLE